MSPFLAAAVTLLVACLWGGVAPGLAAVTLALVSFDPSDLQLLAGTAIVVGAIPFSAILATEIITASSQSNIRPEWGTIAATLAAALMLSDARFLTNVDSLLLLSTPDITHLSRSLSVLRVAASSVTTAIMISFSLLALATCAELPFRWICASTRSGLAISFDVVRSWLLVGAAALAAQILCDVLMNVLRS